MMFLDGCFVLQFMYSTAKNNRGDMGMKSHTIAFVHRDIFLLENQLPFLVLKALMSLRFKEDEEKDIITLSSSILRHFLLLALRVSKSLVGLFL